MYLQNVISQAYRLMQPGNLVLASIVSATFSGTASYFWNLVLGVGKNTR